MRREITDEAESTLTSMNNLAMCYKQTGKLDQALPLFEETLKIKKKVLGKHTLRNDEGLKIGKDIQKSVVQILCLDNIFPTIALE